MAVLAKTGAKGHGDCGFGCPMIPYLDLFGFFVFLLGQNGKRPDSVIILGGGGDLLAGTRKLALCGTPMLALLAIMDGTSC